MLKLVIVLTSHMDAHQANKAQWSIATVASRRSMKRILRGRSTCDGVFGKVRYLSTLPYRMKRYAACINLAQLPLGVAAVRNIDLYPVGAGWVSPVLLDVDHLRHTSAHVY